MISGASILRHSAVGASVAGTALLGLFGVLGPSHPERFDQWQTVVQPSGERGLRITETIDQDFGTNDRHGHLRDIPNDFGDVSDVSVSSATAPDDLRVTNWGWSTEIRIGDADIEISGQHRYEIAYTLPEARLDTGFLALDLIGGLDFETERFEAVITGLELENTECFTGPPGSTTTCEITQTQPGTHEVVVSPLPAFHAITVRGDIVGRSEPTPVAAPPLPERRPDRQAGLIALGLGGLGAITSIPVFFWARRKGRNEVVGSGAADAAFGELPAPGATSTAASTRLVTDAELKEMATIEFTPPRGIEPWEASVLLRERVDGDTVQAFLSGMAGRGAIELTEEGKHLSIAPGEAMSRLPDDDRRHLDKIFAIKNPFVTGKYNSRFATVWSGIESSLKKRIGARGWWRTGVPSSGLSFKFNRGVVAFIAVALVVFSSAFSALIGAMRGWGFSILFAVFVPALVAFAAYQILLPARTSTGSALALRTESFRRFLHASEARHVEWAWSNGLLREYSAWAVALGEADAWSDALERADVPPPARLAAAPLYVHSTRSSFSSSTTAPSSSGSSGSGGFSGGGGGGGGGGSW